VVQAESAFLTAAAADTLAGKALTRAQSLYGGDASTAGISQRELEQATSDAAAARAQLTSARYALRALGESDAAMEALLAGERSHRAAALHEWATAYVAESDSPELRIGESAEIHTVAYPDRTFADTVSKVYAAVDPATHRMALRCEVADPGHLLRPGMLADVTIEVRKSEPSASVPANAVVRESDGTLTAWVTGDRLHFAQRVVTAGLREDGRVQILSGLKPGEQVVTDGAIFLDNMLQAPSGDD
jgi:cobalt-zinc-cadmium efflux system membrane fusion protein